MDGKAMLKFGMGSLNPDGTPNFDMMVKNEMESQMAGKMFGSKPMDEKTVESVLYQAQCNAESLLFPMYKSLNLPMYEGIQPSNMITDGMNGVSIFSEEDLKKLFATEEQKKLDGNNENNSFSK